MSSSTIFFLCSHSNLGLSVVYSCSQSLQPAIYQIYNIALGRT